MFALLAAGFFTILLYMTALWLVSLPLKNSAIVDIFWGPGFALAAWLYFILTPDAYLPRKLLVVGLVTIWGLRLGLHIGRRSAGKSEDYRYRAWREAAGAGWWWRSYFKVFLLQGLLLWLISTPLVVAQLPGAVPAFTVFDALGLLLWGVGFAFEAVGDWQLARFKADPANQGEVLRSGLWRYSRHPNYFGDALLWWGYFALALNLWPYGLLTLYSPILMTALLVRVSGVALLERGLKQTKPGYGDYIATTNAFVPGLPRGRDG